MLDGTLAITENFSVPILTSTDTPIDRYRVTALHAIAVLSNPHSRNCTAAPRFSPTRFIPPARLQRSRRNLIASSL
jgi:hypothetical protein